MAQPPRTKPFFSNDKRFFDFRKPFFIEATDLRRRPPLWMSTYFYILNQETLRTHGMLYLYKMPTAVPPDMLLVHNQYRPTCRLGMRGFRAWLSPTSKPELVPCDCGWASELGEYYRVAPVVANEIIYAVVTIEKPEPQEYLAVVTIDKGDPEP